MAEHGPPSRWPEIKPLLEAILRVEPDNRPALIAELCGGDEHLRREVESYLAYDDPADEFLARAAGDLLGNDRHEDLIGRRIGDFQITRALGSGGMGEVFEAEQLSPIRRKVALKLIRRGMRSEQVQARFAAERQALAMMNHPNIAQVHEAAATDDGRPYFAMELVSGEPITQYCRARHLGIDARLRLVIQVCEGLQHAHQKGVIHRDIKPANILVASVDEQPVPKIIDFGVAKGALPVRARPGAEAESADPGQTLLGQWIGTADYISPEQARGDPDIDTRTDIYSLGALLYETLVGVPPFAGARDAPPPAPSARLATLRATDAAAAARLTGYDAQSARRLPGRLRSDLDAVVLKALEDDRRRRYATAAGFAADLRMVIANLPTAASGGSRGYVLRKFFRRHTVGVAAGTVVASALLAATATATLQARRANQEVETSRQILEFVVDIFRVSDPGEAKGNSVTAREVLDRSVSRLDTELTDQPAVRARLLETIGVVYMNLGLYEKARPLLDDALVERRAQAGADPLGLATSLTSSGLLHYYQGDYADAQRLYDEALAIRQRRLGEPSVGVAESLHNLGSVALEQGDYSRAEQLLRRSLGLRRELLGPNHADIALTLNGLAGTLRRTGDNVGAAERYREAIAMRRGLKRDDDADFATNLANLALVLAGQRQFDEAESLANEALDLRRNTLGEAHPSVANSLHNLASLLRDKGDLDAALMTAVASRDLHLQVFGARHPYSAVSLNMLATLQRDAGDLTAAGSGFREARDILAEVAGDDHPNTAILTANLADLLNRTGDWAEAHDLAAAASEVLKSKLPPGHWRIAVANSVRGAALAGLGRNAEAEPLLVASLATIEAAQGEDSEQARAAAARLAQFRSSASTSDPAD